VDMPNKVTRLTVTTITNTCYYTGCKQPVVSAAAYHSSLYHEVVAVWMCKEHGETFTAPEDVTTAVTVQETTRKCQATTEDGSTCGAYATHVKILGGEYADDRQPEIKIVSVCERHTHE
jgi:hypothetical protein